MQILSALHGLLLSNASHLLSVPLLWSTYAPTMRHIYAMPVPPAPSSLTAVRAAVLAAMLAAVEVAQDRADGGRARGAAQGDAADLAGQSRAYDASELARYAVLLGVLNFAGTAAQADALASVTATRAAFLIQTTSVFVPLVAAIDGAFMPTRRECAAAAVAMVGSYVLLSGAPSAADGAAALVVTRDEAARGAARAVAIRARSQVSDFLPMSRRSATELTGAARAIRQALEAAGLGIRDIDVAEVHDCFTIAEMIEYEAMGLAKPGEGHKVIRDGVSARDGALPINPSGGLKSKGHPIGATGVSMHVMAAMQLAGEAGDIQLPKAELAGVFNMGGAAVANYVSILERVK